MNPTSNKTSPAGAADTCKQSASSPPEQAGQPASRLEKSPIERFAEEANKIQKRCACIVWDADECGKGRAPCGDFERSVWFEEYHEPCECSCHEDIGELELEIFGEWEQ